MIVLKNSQFQLEDDCQSDALYIYDGPNDKAKSFLNSPYCGRKINIILTSSGNTIYMRFKTDHLLSKTGFLFNYKAEPGKCKDIYCPQG